MIEKYDPTDVMYVYFYYGYRRKYFLFYLCAVFSQNIL